MTDINDLPSWLLAELDALDICRIETCSEPVFERSKKRGWCWMHYKRWERHDDPLTVIGPPPCSVEGCENNAAPASGVCPTHRTPTPRGVCAVETCDLPMESAKGKHPWCSTHRQRVKKTGDPQAHRPIHPRGGVCKVEGCNEPNYTFGWCRPHSKTKGGPPVKKSNIKLDEEAVRAIRAALASDEPKADIAARFGVSRSAIDGIYYGRSWKHVS